MRRSVRMLAGGIVLAGLGLVGGGCETFQSSSLDEQESPRGMIFVSVANETGLTCRMSLHVGEQSPGRLGIRPKTDGQKVAVIRGDERTLSVKRPGKGLFSSGSQREDVTRLRVEIVTASWSDRRVRWYEFLGPPPSRVVLSRPSTATAGRAGRAGRGGAPVEVSQGGVWKIVASSDEVPIEEIPFEHWPAEDL